MVIRRGGRRQPWWVLFTLLMVGGLLWPVWAADDNDDHVGDLLPMQRLLRGKAAVPQGTLRETPMAVDPPRNHTPLQEPPPLFPTVMGPLPHQTPPAGLTTLSAQGCNACHGDTHREWRGSSHARAWTNPVYQAALEASGGANGCIHCHTPLSNQQVMLLKGFRFRDPGRPVLEPNPDYDPTLQSEGVTCASCHIRDGMVYGTRTLQPGAAPHAVTAHPDLQRPEFCGSCHQLVIPGAEEHPFYDTLGEWARSPYAAAGVTCQGCHMPLQLTSTDLRVTPRPRRVHAMPGGQDDDMLRRALTLLVEVSQVVVVPGTEVTLTVRLLNSGAGHAVPTTAPFRVLLLRMGELKSGKLTSTKQTTIDRQLETEPPFKQIADHRLPPLGEMVLPYTWKAPAPGVYLFRAEVEYQRMPPEVAAAHHLDPQTLSRVVLSQDVTVVVK